MSISLFGGACQKPLNRKLPCSQGSHPGNDTTWEYYKIKQSENTSSSRLSTSLVFSPCLSLPSTLDGKIIINNHDTLSFLDFEMKAESEAHARRMRMCLDRELVGPSSIRPQSLHSDQPPLPSDRAPSPGKISQGVIFFLHIFESISPSK